MSVRSDAMLARSAFPAMVWWHFLNDSLAGYLPGILALLALERHIPVFLLGSLMSALLFGQMLQPLSGLLADMAGGRTFILLGPILSAISLFGVSYTHSYALLAISLFLSGLGTTLFHPQAMTYVRTLASQRRGLSMSSFMVGGEFGRAVGPLIASALATALGLVHLWLLGFLVLFSAPWLLRVLPKLPARSARGLRISLRGRVRPALALLSFTACRAATVWGVTALVPLIWREGGGSTLLGASLVTTMIGIGIAGNLSGGALLDRIGGSAVLWISSIAATLCLVALSYARGAWLFPIIALLGVALYSSAPVRVLMGQDIFPDNPALGTGIALGLGNGIGALILLPISYYAQHISLHAGLWMIAALMALSLIGVSLLGNVLRESPPRAAVGAGG